MNISTEIKPLTIGCNESICISQSQEHNFSLIDDLSLDSHYLSAKQFTVVCWVINKKYPPGTTCNFVFNYISKLKFQITDTVQKYNVHDTLTDIRLIDQIYFDPNKDFEDYQLQLVGLGWIIGIDAKSFSMEIVYS